MNLMDFAPLMRRRRANHGLGLGLAEFCADPEVASLCRPQDVVEQWLYDHGVQHAQHGRP
ncbi:hypothetical protein ACFVH7_31410 [Kitasatospora indigofera]|uniref:hypothetical protein n=1 Tax=Kitasatospora indigofera TaxID=67307 RepID=UPI003628E499